LLVKYIEQSKLLIKCINDVLQALKTAATEDTGVVGKVDTDNEVVRRHHKHTSYIHYE